MAVPKRKTSKSKRNMRRSHHALGSVTVVENQTSGELSRPHHVSPDGFYKGRKVVLSADEIAEELEKKEAAPKAEKKTEKKAEKKAA